MSLSYEENKLSLYVSDWPDHKMDVEILYKQPRLGKNGFLQLWRHDKNGDHGIFETLFQENTDKYQRFGEFLQSRILSGPPGNPDDLPLSYWTLVERDYSIRITPPHDNSITITFYSFEIMSVDLIGTEKIRAFVNFVSGIVYPNPQNVWEDVDFKDEFKDRGKL